MLTVEECRKIGYNACIDLIGRELCKANAERGSYGSSINQNEERVYCFVGCTDEEEPHSDELQLSETPFKYRAGVYVSRKDGSVEVVFLETQRK